MSQAIAAGTYSLDSVRTIKQNVNLRDEPFLVTNADDVVVFSGWMFDVAGARQPRVFARVEGTDIPAVSARRDDVAETFGRGALHAGFAAAIAIGAFPQRLLDVELVCDDADGRRFPFDRRRIVVVDGASAPRSAAIVVDRCQDLGGNAPLPAEAAVPFGAVVGVEGWGFAAAPNGTPCDAAAVVAGGRTYQATYRIARARGSPGGDGEIGFFAQIPSLHVGKGWFELRARLFSPDGASLESMREFRIRIT